MSGANEDRLVDRSAAKLLLATPHRAIDSLSHVNCLAIDCNKAGWIDGASEANWDGMLQTGCK